jgi:hypothetical protein
MFGIFKKKADNDCCSIKITEVEDVKKDATEESTCCGNSNNKNDSCC